MKRNRFAGPLIPPLIVALAVMWVPTGLLAEGIRKEKEKNQPSVAEALREGKFTVGLRYRIENVSDDAPLVAAKDGNASTLRTTVGYKSGWFRNFRLFAELEDVTDVGLGRQHNNAGAGSLSNGVSDRPTVADPEVTEVNQANLQFRGFRNTTVTLGRQAINLGGQRFVGVVGWRQNQQSYDALRITQGSIRRTTLNYVFVYNVNRIFGDNRNMHSHLLDAKIKFGDRGSLTPYVYILDYDAIGSAGLSTSTYGARWEGRQNLPDGWWLPYRVELAQQSDTGDNPGNVDAGYRAFEVSAGRNAVLFTLGYELLEGSPGDGVFSTPLATLHRFNGWADKFLTTPPEGLEDIYIGARWDRAKTKFQLFYHEFGADSVSADYGSELDFQLSYTAPWDQLFALKLASFDSDGFSATLADTEKVMIWTVYYF